MEPPTQLLHLKLADHTCENDKKRIMTMTAGAENSSNRINQKKNVNKIIIIIIKNKIKEILLLTDHPWQRSG